MVYSTIGKAIEPNNMSSDEWIVSLRDAMATLKWKLMKVETMNNPVTIPHGDAGLVYWKQIIDNEIASVKFYDREAEQLCVYNPERHLQNKTKVNQ